MPRRGGSGRAWLSLLFGLGALALTLAPVWSNRPVHLVWTTVGLTAVYFGIAHLARRRRGLARGRAVASVGIGSGALATVLLVWGVVWAEFPVVPAPPQAAFAGAFTPRVLAAPLTAPTPVASLTPIASMGTSARDHSYEVRPGRVVPPIPSAREVEPAYQLQANLVVTAYEICTGLNTYRAKLGALPNSLAVGDDGRVSGPRGTFSVVLPAYMRISYVPDAPDGTAYLTVADAESGMAMSCVRSGKDGWIANS